MFHSKFKLVLMLVFILPVLGIASGTWLMHEHDPQHSGYVPDNVTLPLVEKWSCPITGQGCYPAVENGKIYLQSYDGSSTVVYAANITDGSVVWRFILPGTTASLSVIDGVVYTGDWTGDLHAINAETGVQIWNVNYGSTLNATIIVDGVIYTCGVNGTVFAINTADGSTVWTYPTGASGCYCSPVTEEGILYLVINSKVYALDLSDGSFKWEYSYSGTASGPICIGDGAVYFGTQGGDFYAVNTNGTLRWQYTPPYSHHWGQSICNQGKVFVGVSPDRVYCFNSQTGGVNWYYTSGGIVDSVAVANDKVFFGARDNYTRVCDVETGNLLWSKQISTTNWVGTTIIVDGIVYVSGGASAPDAKLYAFQTESVCSSAWVTTSSLPSALLDFPAVVGKGYVYVVGGQYSSGARSDAVLRAPIQSDESLGSWEQITTLPGVRNGAAAVIVGDNLYILGGSQGDFADLNTVLRATLNTDGSIGSWVSEPSLSVARHACAAAAFNGYIYVIGGANNGARLSSCERAKINGDGSLGSWEACSSMEVSRWKVATIAANGYLYAIGGLSGSGYVGTIERAAINADGSLGAWSYLGSTISNPDAMAAVIRGNEVYIAGGSPSSGIPVVEVTKSIANLDGSLSSWETIAPLNQSRKWHGMANSATALYVLGGLNYDGGVKAINSVEYIKLADVNDLTYWDFELYGDATAPGTISWVDSFVGQSGVIKVDQIPGEKSKLSQIFSIPAPGWYTAHAKVATDIVDVAKQQKVYLYLQELDNSSTVVASGNLAIAPGASGLGTASTWRDLSISYYAQNTILAVQVVAINPTLNSATGSLYIDDIWVTTGAIHPTQSISIPNADFENGTDNWLVQPYAGAGTPGYWAGWSGLLVGGQNGGEKAKLSQVFSAPSNQDVIEGSVWVFSGASSISESQKVYLYIYSLDTGTSRIIESGNAILQPGMWTPGEWRQIKFGGYNPLTQNNAVQIVVINQDSNPYQAIYFDALELKQD